MQSVCIFSRQLNLIWLTYPLLVLIGSYKVYKFPEIKGTYHETICQNIKKLTSPSKIIRYKNMNNFFHHSMKNFQMEFIFGPYLPKLGQKLLKINEFHVAALKNTHKIASCSYLQGRYLY